MTVDDLEKGWERLRTVYSNLPKFDTALGKEWLRALEGFSGADLDAAVSMWISGQKYRPTPYDLAKYCRKAQARRQREAAELAAQANGSCPWCGGLGYVAQIFEPEAPDRYFYCVCGASPDPEKGAKILSAARNDGAWVFDRHRHGFRQRRKWVGDPEPADDRPLPLAQQQAFWQGVNAALR